MTYPSEKTSVGVWKAVVVLLVLNCCPFYHLSSTSGRRGEVVGWIVEPQRPVRHHKRDQLSSSRNSVTSASTTPTTILSSMSDPTMTTTTTSGSIPNGGSMKKVDETPLYWSRDLVRDERETTLAIVRTAKVISLSDPNDPTNDILHKQQLPDGVELLQVGTTLQDFDIPALLEAGVNTIFVSYSKAREPLAQLISALTGPSNTNPSSEQNLWIHCRNAGIDSLHSSALVDAAASHDIYMTNAKGQFSSSLAEYAMAACLYFAKDFHRLKSNQHDKHWDQYKVLELRGATMGIVGYGDIGKATARLAKSHGMKVMALSRRSNNNDPYVDELVTDMQQLFRESDYIFCALPLTSATKGMIGHELFNIVKPGCVFINVGRGPVVDEDALIAALQPSSSPGQPQRRLKGAALDVFTIEPLPKESALWHMDNVLLSPHNMDYTATSQSESTEFFVHTQLPRFVRGLQLYNEVDPVAGY